jgi:transcriptional regulator with XRE-family HTH domain
MPDNPKPLIQEHLPSVKKNKKSRLPPNTEIGERLRLARGDRAATDIEALSGVSNTAIGKCEKGKQTPSLDLLAYYSHAEGIPMDLIVFGSAPIGDSLVALRMQCLALPPEQRIALAREILADLERPGEP